MKKIVVAVFGILCLICNSCTKEDMEQYSYTNWEGNFTVKVKGGSSYVNMTATIGLYFSDDLAFCQIKTKSGSWQSSGGYGRIFYEVRWTSDDSFDLYPQNAEQKQKTFTATISNKRIMTLTSLQGESTGTTYKLYRIKEYKENRY